MRGAPTFSVVALLWHSSVIGERDRGRIEYTQGHLCNPLLNLHRTQTGSVALVLQPTWLTQAGLLPEINPFRDDQAIQSGFAGAHPAHQWAQCATRSCYFFPARWLLSSAWQLAAPCAA